MQFQYEADEDLQKDNWFHSDSQASQLLTGMTGMSIGTGELAGHSASFLIRENLRPPLPFSYISYQRP